MLISGSFVVTGFVIMVRWFVVAGFVVIGFMVVDLWWWVDFL